jgi:hypothetical protein
MAAEATLEGSVAVTTVLNVATGASFGSSHVALQARPLY